MYGFKVQGSRPAPRPQAQGLENDEDRATINLSSYDLIEAPIWSLEF